MDALRPGIIADTPSATTLAADAALWQLYESSFPSSEREPRDVILAGVRAGVGVVVRARSHDATVGFAASHLLRDPPAVFLVYLAVAAELRSRRIGAALFEEAWTDAAKRHAAERRHPIGFVWEVEDPGLASGPAEAAQRQRRIAFFERCGGTVLAQRYLQPPVDGIAPVPMRLMFRAAPGGLLPDAAVASQLIRAIYFEKYLAMNGIDRATLEDLLHG